MDEAHRRLLALLGDLLLEPHPETLAVARLLPALHLTGTDEELAASHHAALGLETLPYAPAFLSPDGLLSDPERDHLGAWMIAASRGQPDAVTVLQRALPPFVLALRDSAEPAWATAAELALQIVTRSPAAPWSLDHALPALDDPKTDLRALATALVRPARSGWAPTHRALRRVAAAAHVPAGFGDRATRLHTAILSAVDAGRLTHLLGAVDEELRRWDQGLVGLGVPVEPWRGQVGAARALVAAARDVARHGWPKPLGGRL